MNRLSVVLCVSALAALPACAQKRAEAREAIPEVVVQPRTIETELAALTRLEREIQLLEPLLREAQNAAQSNRLQFDYDALRLDLDRIRLGIREYRAGELSQPRQIEPLSGDYRR